MRYIPNDKNSLYYKDINLNLISPKKTNSSSNSLKHAKDVNVNRSFIIYQNRNSFNIEYIGYPLENYLDKNTIKLFGQIELDEYDLQVIDDKKYLVKTDLINKNNINLN